MDNLENKITSEQLIDLVNNKKYQEIRDLFVKYPEIDIAEICNEIDDVTIIITIFRVVKSEFTAELFHNLDQDHQEALIKAMTDKDINTLIGASANDDIVDFLEDMPANLVKRVLQQTTKDDRVVINKLLNYKENTAGSIMTTEYIELLDTTLIQDAISLIRQNGKDAETIYTIFCKDIKRNFLGTVDLDDLIFAQPTQTLNEIMNKDFVTVDVNTDQEEVAQIVKRYDLNAIAVLNDDHKLSGIITIDDVVDIIDKEATEDIAYQAGVSPLQEKYLETPVFKMAFKCIPWLMLLLVLGVFSSMVLSSFQSALALVPILSAFIPAVMDAGGNAGSQTSSVVVRSLALNEFKPKDFFKVLWKEVRIAMVTACILAIFAYCWTLIEQYTGLVSYHPGYTDATGVFVYYKDFDLFIAYSKISGLVGITLFTTIILSKIIGCILPLIAKAIHIDPALMSGPFITTIVDVCSLLLYFFICVDIFKIVG